jgi:outer membrane protein
MNNDKKNNNMKKPRSNRKAIMLIAALLPVMAMAQTATSDTVKPQRYEFSLQQAIDYASKNNIDVKKALLDVKYQEQVNREVTSLAYPNISGNISTTYNPNVATQVIPNFIGPATYQVLIDEGVQNGSGQPIQMPNDFGFIAAQFGTKFSANVGLSLSQTLFDGQVFVGLQARKSIMDFYRKNVEVTDELIRTNIHKIYYQLVIVKKQIALQDSQIVLTEKNLRDTRIMYDNGFKERLDIDRINVELANQRTYRNLLVNQASNGYYSLKVLMGMPVKHQLILTDDLTEEQIKDGALELASYDYKDRRIYQYLELSKTLREYDIRRYKLSQIPTVTLNGQYAKNAQRDKWNFFSKGEWYSISNVSLNINVPIFRGFYTKSKIEQAKINLQKAQEDLNQMELNIDNEVASARDNYRFALTDLDVQRQNMDLAGSVYQQTKKKYEMGTASQTEINQAQSQLQLAQNNYTAAMLRAITAKVDFQKATGKL